MTSLFKSHKKKHSSSNKSKLKQNDRSKLVNDIKDIRFRN